MNSQQRDNWYFDILWSKINDQNPEGQDITNFISGKKAEKTSRLGALAYGKKRDKYDLYLSAVLRARFEELASGDTKKSLEERKANYLTILLNIFEEKLSKSEYPDIFDKIHDFLFQAPHAETDLEGLASWAYICSSSNVCEELLAALLKARFKELVTGVTTLTQETVDAVAKVVPRYRDEVKECKIEDFAIDSPQRNVLSASVLELHQNGYIHVVTISKLTTLGILSGLHLFKTNPEWLKQHFDENELQAIENLFVGAHLNWVVPKDNLTEDQKTFLSKPNADVALSATMYSCIMSYNNGRTIEQQCLTAGDIYMTSKHDVLKKMKAGKKQISELIGLFEAHGLTWS